MGISTRRAVHIKTLDFGVKNFQLEAITILNILPIAMEFQSAWSMAAIELRKSYATI